MKPINESVQHVLEELGIINELYEPKTPSGIKRSTVSKAGVQGSTIKLNQYAFTTSQGNVVKVQFKIDPSDKSEADVVFYVNDTLDDDSSGGLDTEIMSGVLGIIKKVADSRKLNTITFSAWAGKGDTKRIKGLKEDREGFQQIASPILSWTEQNEPETLPPTDRMRELAAALGREPKSRQSWPKEQLEKALGHLMAYLHDGSGMFQSIVYELENEPIYAKLGEVIPGWDAFLKEARKLADARMSNTDSGLTVRRNRRAAVYDRLIQRFMADEWKVEKSYDSYTLTRKDPK